MSIISHIKSTAITVALAASLMAGCSQTPLATIIALNRIDPMKSDPAALRVAAILDETILLKPSDIHLVMSITATSQLPEETHRIRLQSAAHGAAETRLQAGVPSGDRLLVFQMHRADIALFKTLRQKGAAEDRHGSLTVDINEPEAAAASDADVPVAIYLKVGELDDYLLLYSD